MKNIKLNFRGLTHQSYISYPGEFNAKYTNYFLCCPIEKFHQDTQFENYLKIIEYMYKSINIEAFKRSIEVLLISLGPIDRKGSVPLRHCFLFGLKVFFNVETLVRKN